MSKKPAKGSDEALVAQIKSAAIELRAVKDLIPYARNSRKHEDWQVAKIAGSIREFGFTSPVLIDEDGGIIAGHARVMAAQTLDLKQVPCLVLAHLTPTQRKAYVIADNRLAELSTWDMDALRLEVEDLTVEDYDLSLIGWEGFGSVESSEETQDDEPAGSKKPIVCPNCSHEFTL